MSYFKTLQRAATGISEAQPRPVSLYERSDAEWEIEADPLTSPTVASNSPLKPAITEKRQTTSEKAGPPKPHTNAVASEEKAVDLIPQVLAPLPQPTRPAVVDLDSITKPETKPPVSPALQAVAPPHSVPTPTRYATPAEQESPTIQPVREVEIRTERPIRIEAQPVATEPPADERPAAPPQTVFLVPAPEANADAEPISTPPARETRAAPTLLIEIGQIDIRLTAPASAAPIQPARREASPPILSLDDYLKGRS
ncbi:hypothetical protein N2599_18560 [Rhizobium sullae]|uniref:Uncharacterized protein n=1 Tax=Rhizobium sullae TaxID=50338 RepID=A0ABY5XJI5_RHISU|nr:hypothetical protein [Rhizobium sullae]UWU14093.1 hypothetical protein N2599_18560 [Rhizobium sullae]